MSSGICRDLLSNSSINNFNVNPSVKQQKPTNTVLDTFTASFDKDNNDLSNCDHDNDINNNVHNNVPPKWRFHLFHHDQ